MNKDAVLRSRQRHGGPSLSLSYQEPLMIVRGEGVWLYDEEDRAYLDCVNNVCHVGHCHPKVVEAGQRQMARLNTNTRYLNPARSRYIESLLATFPAPLDVCFLVCSGSEANDLALRLARSHSAGRHVLVLDGAYHGNTSSVIELSPYKFNGKGGRGEAPHIKTLPAPDGYRGPWRYGDEGRGAKYVDQIRSVLDSEDLKREGVGAFFCESMLGCGGQIVLPPGYLKGAFAAVREAGGVCVADEVQVGFGRCGSKFWAFEMGEVVPDIVTLGKPMGNGHPMAAVVTTREIAESFADGMEYFNTFGGNPVSCAVGQAVLDVIEEEGLQENARQVGEFLKGAFRALAGSFPLIGDVRGEGLFLGLELVKDQETLEPAPEEASRVVELMKARGILLSTDGPLHNVIKMKPPLVFQKEHGERLVEELGKVFLEL